MTGPTRPSGRGTDADDRSDDGAPVDAATEAAAADADEAAPRPQRRGRLDFLYEGNGGFDVIGARRKWYLALSAVLLICVLSMVFRGFNFGIDFVGGTTVQLPAQGAAGEISISQVEETFAETLGRTPTSVQTAGAGGSATILVRTERLTEPEVIELRAALFQDFQPLGATGAPDPAAVSDSLVSASWGNEITRQALIALAVFLVLVSIYLVLYFEPRMAIAAMVTLVYDIVITAGVYSLVGFEVSPATVIGLLTILGYSLYDTVIVFDKVRENVRGLESRTRRTYAEAANLAVNQTLMRSLNTTLTSLLPLLALFVIGVGLLGVGVLGDLALVQLVGTFIGTVSSVILAAPLLADLAMRTPTWSQHAQRVEARRASRARRGDAAPGTEEAAGERTDVFDVREVAGAGVGASGGTGASRRSRTTPGLDARPSGKSGRPSGKRRR